MRLPGQRSANTITSDGERQKGSVASEHTRPGHLSDLNYWENAFHEVLLLTFGISGTSIRPSRVCVCAPPARVHQGAT